MINIIFTQRMKVSVATGAVLGVICIMGAWIRSGLEQDALYLFAFWYNRLLMGVVIGFAGVIHGLPKIIGRGVLLGLLVSFAFYSSTGFLDPLGFIAGIFYGVVIEYIGFKYTSA